MNPYLQAQRGKYAALVASIEGLQNRAAEADRDLTEDELRSVQQQGEQAKKLAAEIESLTEIETRNRKVQELAAQVTPDEKTETRSEQPGAVRVGSTYTKDRDPGHYRRDGKHSYFSDLFHSRSLHDDAATRRLLEHNRALDMAGEGPGVIPPVWLASEFAELARQGRRVASAVRNIGITDARARSLPKQTAGTDSVVVQQGSENAATTWTDAWDSAVDTVTPRATAGGQKVSRQMLDSGDPVIDQLIWGDLMAAYNQKVEAEVIAAMVASAGSAVTTYATEAAWTTAVTTTGTMSDDLIDLAVAVRVARKLPADVLVLSVARYGDLLKLKDDAGRPLIPMDSAGPMNVIGTGSVAVDGRVHGLGVIASDGVTQYPESILAARASDTILFESPTLRVKYEEPEGPETIRLAIWGYTAVYVQYAGASVKHNVITASV